MHVKMVMILLTIIHGGKKISNKRNQISSSHDYLIEEPNRGYIT